MSIHLFAHAGTAVGSPGTEQMYLAGGASFRSLPEAAGELIGLFVAIPRIVFGPVFLVIEGATFLLVHERVTHQSFFCVGTFFGTASRGS